MSIGLAHFFVCSCLADTECPVGFLQGDVDVWLPLALFFLIAGEVVCAVLKGEVDSRTSVDAVEEPTEQKAEDKAPTTGYAPTDDGKDETKA